MFLYSILDLFIINYHRSHSNLVFGIKIIDMKSDLINLALFKQVIFNIKPFIYLNLIVGYY